jgi:hypothetical protein
VRVASPPWSPRREPVELSTLVVFMFVCGLGACDLITGPLPPGAERFTPPAVYARWWAMTAACSGRSGDLRAVQWYRVPGSDLVYGGQLVGGYWSRNSNRIVIGEDHIREGRFIRHEMLHALLRTAGHPRAQFLGACASLVSCQEFCVRDAGLLHPPEGDYVILPPESLAVASHAELLAPELDGERWVTLEVTVRNLGQHALVVAFPGELLRPRTFSFDLRGPLGGISGDLVATDSSAVFFEPFETKQWLFEFQVASEMNEYQITPGNYLVRGGYAGHSAAYESIAITR